jgi:hypothetical protein
MIIRIFRARPQPGRADELARLAEEISIPFVDGQSGLVARYAGRGAGATGEELVMVSVAGVRPRVNAPTRRRVRPGGARTRTPSLRFAMEP